MNESSLENLRRDAAVLVLTVGLSIYCYAQDSQPGPMWFALILSLVNAITIVWRLSAKVTLL